MGGALYVFILFRIRCTRNLTLDIVLEKKAAHLTGTRFGALDGFFYCEFVLRNCAGGSGANTLKAAEEDHQEE